MPGERHVRTRPGVCRAVRLGSADLWLGDRGSACRGRLGVDRLTYEPMSAAAHNLDALAMIRDATASEVVFVGREHGWRSIATLPTRRRLDPAELGRDWVRVARVWNTMISMFPGLPWSRVVVVRGDQTASRAFAVPGAVVLGPAVQSQAMLLLYVTHELVHQWLGGMVAPNTAPDVHAVMEAHTDALAWHVTQRTFPAVSLPYEALFSRYLMFPALAEHARRVFELRERPASHLVEGLVVQVQSFGGGRARARYLAPAPVGSAT